MAVIQAIQTSKGLRGTVVVPGDKSISHRAVMLGALAEGVTEITGFLYAEDCVSTIRAFGALGIDIEVTLEKITIHGRGLQGLTEPDDVINVGNSGTTMRLLSGILAGQKFNSFLTGDQSIRKRPMGRVIVPLKKMGAQIIGKQYDTMAPLAIVGTPLQNVIYESPVASAQVKSAILLAGLYADGWTEVREPALSRNHTELMLASFGAQVVALDNGARVLGHPVLHGQSITVPGDISSAAYLLVAGSIVPNSRIILKNVGLNPTRTGIIDVLQAMGAKITLMAQWCSGGEALGNLLVESSPLHGITIGGAMIPTLIDEIPIIAVAAACASGITEIHDAQELKVKESNRLETIAEGLRAMGCQLEVLADGLKIYGGQPLHGAVCTSYDDHRIAMSLAVAGLVAAGTTEISQFEAVAVSWPDFCKNLTNLEHSAEISGEVGCHD